mgnify:FL=1
MDILNSVNFMLQIPDISKIVYFLKICFMSTVTCYTAYKLTDNIIMFKKKLIKIIIINIVISYITTIIRYIFNLFISDICLIFILGCMQSIINKQKIGYSILLITIALAINYIILFLTTVLTFPINIFYNIKNDYINLMLIIIIYLILICLLFKIKKFKHGFLFLKRNIENEYIEIWVLNISSIILFSSIIFNSSNFQITRKLFIGFIIFSIIMFITIQKSLQLYYKQRLLVQDLEETKKELEDKKKEIKQLEQENLNFSKTSHSIAHKQKALEYKLNELALKNEIAEEIDVKNRLNNITKQISEEPEIEIPKTNISEIDDMLNYMKSECIKNKIKFEVQLNGNIYQMINNHITKEELEILIADHVKNAIIAVKCSNNSNRSILVRIGKIDGQYSIYIYDSGIEFEINTLHKLGKIPSTTHKESGGTGMGFMNTFDTLKKHKASITINEYGKPAKDNYTKVIMIVFNKKDEFNIISYRQKEIEVRKDEVNV